MAKYHLYFLRQGMLVGSGDIEAADDQDAARIAREQGDGNVVEVWSEDRRVRIIAPVKPAAGPGRWPLAQATADAKS